MCMCMWCDVVYVCMCYRFWTRGYVLVRQVLYYFFFLWYWSLNSGLTPWATPSSPFLWWIFFEIGSPQLFALADFDPPHLCLLRARITCVSHLLQPASSFCSGYFGDSVLPFAQASLAHPSILCFPLLLEWQVCAPTPSFFLLRWGLTNFIIVELAWNCDPPHLSLFSN
jgi:hypothetical protein